MGSVGGFGGRVTFGVASSSNSPSHPSLDASWKLIEKKINYIDTINYYN
jgi:hypothetical protein